MNIFVGSLPFGLKEDDLKEIFEEFGEVSSAKIITDKFSGRSKGFGFIEMPNIAEGKKAIEELNGAEIEGRAIVVNAAVEKKDRDKGGFGGGFNKGGGYKGGDHNKGGFNRDKRRDNNKRGFRRSNY
ncbi:MAG: RNA-binding protein [Bacteroidia bacterium]|nr:RNA-binding protein [Bacteroidia bacterium]